jgi:hypothetical protein
VRCPHSFPRSKHLNLSYERAFGAYSANQEIDVATQHNIFAANQGTVENSTTSLQPIRSDKIKQWRRDRPRSDAVVFKTSPASIAMDRSRICSPRSASPSASRCFQCLIPGINLPHALSNHEVFAHKNAQNGGQDDDGHPECTEYPVLCSWWRFGGSLKRANPFRNGWERSASASWPFQLVA